MPEPNSSTTSNTVANTPAPLTNQAGDTLRPSHPKFDAVMSIIEALIPFALAGTAPFIKSDKTAAVVNAETPVAVGLLDALRKL